jgi:ABC-2 type transport system ATP-binding protein
VPRRDPKVAGASAPVRRRSTRSCRCPPAHHVSDGLGFRLSALANQVLAIACGIARASSCASVLACSHRLALAIVVEVADRAHAEDSAANGAPALRVDNLTKRFGERVAFQDVSFTVALGEVFGFLGPNGAGKTTTVRTLGTLVAPTSGFASVAGIPLTSENGAEIRQRISIMPENPGLYQRLTVIENLQLFAGLYGQRNTAPRIGEALEAVNLTARGRDPCGSLSKGLRQRVGLARALLNDPTVMFLDEPTSGLDPVAAREVHDLINGLRQRGVTVFLTTHRLEEAERLCDRVAILNTTLRLVGRPDELRESLFSRSLMIETLAPLRAPDEVFKATNGVESWRTEGASRYVLTVTDPRNIAPRVTRELVAAGADVVSISEPRHSLEDVYLQLIDEDPEASRR